MPTVAVTGAAGIVGQRLVDALVGLGSDMHVVAIDAVPFEGRGAQVHVLDLLKDDVKRAMDGVDVVVHLAWESGTPKLGPTASRLSLELTDRVLEAASATGVDHFVAVSSATVYGAWADNAVPLPESAPPRPNPGSDYALAKNELEARVVEWQQQHPGTTETRLRPALCVGAGKDSWLARQLGGLRVLRLRGASRPLQFLHVDDLVSALVLVVNQRVEGVLNVAPDAWISADVARSLVSGPVRLPLPSLVAPWLLGLPRSYLPYLTEPWIVANDRLKQLSWTPQHSNEEALVAGRRPTPWQRVSPRRRQELALGGAGATVVGVLAGAVALFRRARRPG